MTTWKSKIGEMPDLQYIEAFEPDSTAYAEWLEGVMAEPWFLALEALVQWTGTWVGTEQAFFAELRMRVGEDVFSSPDFPSTLGRLDEYIEIAIDGFCGRNLMVWHHGELTEEDLDHYDVPEWGPESPILVCQGRAAERPEYYEAMCRFLVRGDALPLAVLIFTGEDRDFRRFGTWIGKTEELLKKLRRYDPNNDFVPYVPRVLAKTFRPADRHEDRPAFGFDPPDVLHPSGRAGYLGFHRALGRWTPALAEFGVRIGRQKDATPYRPHETGEAGQRSTTRWTIEAPRWKKRDELFRYNGAPSKDLTVLVNSWIAPRR
jgi:hypothetical protein